MEQDVVNNIFQGRCYSTGFFRRQNRPRILARARYFLPVFFLLFRRGKYLIPTLVMDSMRCEMRSTNNLFACIFISAFSLRVFRSCFSRKYLFFRAREWEKFRVSKKKEIMPFKFNGFRSTPDVIPIKGFDASSCLKISGHCTANHSPAVQRIISFLA